MSDLIERQAAIDVLSLGKEVLSRVLDDMDVVGADREKYSWGLGLIESYINDIEELPSTQPEPCEDAVSRRRLLGDLKELTAAWGKYPVMEEQIKGVEAAIGYVETIPSAQPEPSTEIQEILNYLDTTLHPIVSPDNWNVYAELHDMVSRLPSAQPEQRWIPCSERLPETHAVDVIEVNGEKHVGFRLSKPVLGYAPGMDDEVEIATVWCEEDLDGSTSWITAPDCERVNVIAWMPLPEPYQGGGNDETD